MEIDGPRACRESELPELLALANSIFREGTEQSLETDYPWVFNPERLQYLRIIKVDGKIVGHVPVMPRQVAADEDRFTIGIISPTGTHPDHRHRSYGSRGLRDCIQLMEQNAWPVSVLWTIEPTFPFYQNLGWEAVASQGSVYQLKSADQNLFKNDGLEVVALEQYVCVAQKPRKQSPWRSTATMSGYQKTTHRSKSYLDKGNGRDSYLVRTTGTTRSIAKVQQDRFCTESSPSIFPSTCWIIPDAASAAETSNGLRQ